MTSDTLIALPVDDLTFAIEVCEDWLHEYDRDHHTRGTYAKKIEALSNRLRWRYEAETGRRW